MLRVVKIKMRGTRMISSAAFCAIVLLVLFQQTCYIAKTPPHEPVREVMRFFYSGEDISFHLVNGSMLHQEGRGLGEPVF